MTLMSHGESKGQTSNDGLEAVLSDYLCLNRFVGSSCPEGGYCHPHPLKVSYA